MSAAPLSAADTCAVVVTYHPDEGLAERLAAIARHAARIVVVDNASNPAARAELERLAAAGRIETILNDRNLGVATALNQGCRRAGELGCAWALLFDQDSRPDPELLAEMGRVLASYPEPERVAVIGANHVNPVSRLTANLGRGRRGEEWVEKEAVITSGSLTRLSIYGEIGPFRDDFFIDEVDHEYCLRARSRGYAVLMTRRPLLEHSLGRVRRSRFFGRDVHPTHHAPFRWYYMTRNQVVVLRDYLRREPLWVLAATVAHLKAAFKVVLFEEQKGTKLAFAWRGLRDALRGRMGPLE